eukprot:TRINITY_DN26884_c0_g2_i1.p1 TRINITY_DN26884_c0_g2~~TRINITY_DN26884_c0_g2_i1.p1  ORF type:complete len:365 (-),score=15.53 TRINITY_DN26884_c0_g2_i1:302-1396(-)
MMLAQFSAPLASRVFGRSRCFGRLRYNGSCPYLNAPFSDMSPSRRATIFEDVAKQIDRDRNIYTIREATPGMDKTGNRLGRNRLPYDWLRTNGKVERRVEAKSCSSTWDNVWKRWRVCFMSVQFSKFDDLVLVVYLPWGLELWEYDVANSSGRTTQGVRTSVHGQRIQFYGQCHERCLHESFRKHIRPRLQNAASHIVSLGWQHDLLQDRWLEASRTRNTYSSTPLADMSPARRGYVLELIARQYDSQFTVFDVEDAEVSLDVRGYRRGKHMQLYDWWRKHRIGEQRVEAKSSSFLWDGRRWRLSFSCVQFIRFDRLVLIVYAPWGVELYDYDTDRACCVTHAGQDDVRGKRIVICGKVAETSL